MRITNRQTASGYTVLLTARADAEVIEEKCKKAYPQADFDEVILLIVSALLPMGAIVSTSLLDPALDIGRMNAELSPILDSS